MTNEQKNKIKKYDLEDRTLAFAKRVRCFVKDMHKTVTDIEDCRQLIRSSGSVGANYVEANEAFSKKEYILRTKISRKEAKECIYWLNLIEIPNDTVHENERTYLIQEATEIMHIFGAILRNCE